MEQAMIEINDIKRMEEAIKKTDSPYLINDYQKAIARKTKELKLYCKYKGLDYEKLFTN